MLTDLKQHSCVFPSTTHLNFIHTGIGPVGDKYYITLWDKPFSKELIILNGVTVRCISSILERNTFHLAFTTCLLCMIYVGSYSQLNYTFYIYFKPNLATMTAQYFFVCGSLGFLVYRFSLSSFLDMLSWYVLPHLYSMFYLKAIQQNKAPYVDSHLSTVWVLVGSNLNTTACNNILMCF